MSAIIEALKEQRGTRVSFGSRWLVWDAKDGWVVYGRGHGRCGARRLVTTKNESHAIKYLLYGEEN